MLEWTQTRRPRDLPVTPTTSMLSNCDYSVDDGAEGLLKDGAYTRYAGWNFNGQVWWTGERYACEVWVYKEYQRTVEAGALADIMAAVSDEYGYD